MLHIFLVPCIPPIVCVHVMEMSLAYLEDYIISCPGGRSLVRQRTVRSGRCERLVGSQAGSRNFPKMII